MRTDRLAWMTCVIALWGASAQAETVSYTRQGVAEQNFVDKPGS